MQWKGQWRRLSDGSSATKTYVVGDMVTDLGITYICLEDTDGTIVPSINSLNVYHRKWDILSGPPSVIDGGVF